MDNDKRNAEAAVLQGKIAHWLIDRAHGVRSSEEALRLADELFRGIEDHHYDGEDSTGQLNSDLDQATETIDRLQQLLLGVSSTLLRLKSPKPWASGCRHAYEVEADRYQRLVDLWFNEGNLDGVESTAVALAKLQPKYEALVDEQEALICRVDAALRGIASIENKTTGCELDSQTRGESPKAE